MTSDELALLIHRLRTAGKSEGRIALVGTATCAQAADALEATLPQEREGRCVCGYCEHSGAEWRIGGVPKMGDTFCPRCGAELGPDGIARRNADTDRAALDRVRELVAEGLTAYPETLWPQPEAEEPASEAERRGECWAATGARLAYRNMQAALDGLAPLQAAAGQDGEQQGIVAIIGKWPGDETDKEIKEALEAMRPPHPDTERLDALERMVSESAARGEAVELDGRGDRTRVERWGAGHVFEVSAEGGDLRAAIDAAMEAGHE